MSRKTILPFQQAPQSICVLRLSAIGDICHTVPVINAIRDQWPDTKITWIIGKLEASLVGDLPGIEFVIYDKKEGRSGRKKIKAALAGRQFDVLLHMQISLRSSMIARTINAKIKLGFDKTRAKDYQWLFTNARISHKRRQHVMDGLFGFAETIGVKRPADEQLRWDIPISQPDIEFAKQLMQGQPYILISPCSSQRARNFRNWSIKDYSDVCKEAVEKHNLKVVITGGNTELERNYGDGITSELRNGASINVVGKTTLKQLYALIASAEAVICPDSGPAHMANSVHTPVIGLYVTSNPLRTGPYFSTKSDDIVNRYPEALKKYSDTEVSEVSWGKRVREADAMGLISVKDVNAALNQVLARRNKAVFNPAT